MSSANSQELNQCEEMIKGLLLPDNTLRKQAESKLQQLLSTVASRQTLCLYCAEILNISNDASVKTYCAIIIRKVFHEKDEKILSETVKSYAPESKEQLKKNLLASIQKTTEKNLRKQISDATINYYAALTENEEKYPELLEYLISIFNLELNEQNISQIELGLYILANIYQVAYEELNSKVEIFLKNFAIYFKCNSLSIKSQTVDCIVELLCSTLSKKEVKQFKDYIFFILETTLKCLEAHDIENLKICLDSIADLAEAEPKILRKNFNDIFILMSKIVDDKEIDENLREIAYEIIVGIIEGIPKIMDNEDEKLKGLIQSLFKYAMEMDQDIDEEWTTPKSEVFVSDEFIPESKLDEVINLLKRLFEICDEKKVYNIIFDSIKQLIQNSSDQNWKYKYIAYITIASITENIEDFEVIKDIFKNIKNDVNNPNLKIQYASVYCIAEFSDGHEPEFQNEFHSEVIPLLLNKLNESKCLRVQLEVVDALDCFIEHLTDDDAQKYIQEGLKTLLNIFMKDNKECPSSLKQGILDVIDDFITASEESFKKYGVECFEILVKYLKEILNLGNNKVLIGPLLEVISKILPFFKELSKKYLEIIIDTLITIQKNIADFKQNISESLLSTWENLIQDIRTDQKQKIPLIVGSLVEVIKKPPEMSIGGTNMLVNIEEFFKNEDEKKQDSKDNKDKPVEEKQELKTSETEEFANFEEILNKFLYEFPELYPKEIIEELYPLSLKLIKYPNEDIQKETADIFANSIRVLSKNGLQVELLHQTSKKYISHIMEQISIETNYSVLCSLLDALKEIINSTKLFLTTQEINQFCQSLLSSFDKIEEGRKNLLNVKEQTEKEFEEDKKKGDNKIYSDDEDDNSDEKEAIDDIKEKIEDIEDVLHAFGTVFGALFDTHKEHTLDMVEKLLKEYLPKYLDDKSSDFEKVFGLVVLGYMAEFLTQKVIGNIWNDLCNIFIKYSTNNSYEVRNACAYDLGIFAKFTYDNFKNYSTNILKALIDILEYKDAKIIKDKKASKTVRQDLKFVKDNAVSALGKIIKYHGVELENLNSWVDKWVNELPITKDLEEGKLNNQFLLEILEKDPSKVLGDNNKNLSHIIVILSKAHGTGGSNEECDKAIDNFAKKILQNEQTKKVLDDLIANYKKGKTLQKIKGIFKDA